MLLNVEKGTHPLVLHAAGKAVYQQRWKDIVSGVLPRLRPVPPAENYYKVITWNTLPIPGILEWCCEMLKVPVMVLGKEYKGKGGWLNIYKMHTTLAAIKKMSCKYVIGLDSWDVLLTGDPKWIIDEYRSVFRRKYGKQMVFNAASSRYPKPRFIDGEKAGRAADYEDALCKRLSKKNAQDYIPNCYLNAGVWVAQRGFLLEFLPAVIANWEALREGNDGKYAHSEQAWVKLTAWADFSDQVGIDSGNTMFQHMRDGTKAIACPDVDVFIDLGAGIGDTVRRLRGTAKKIYAFEANTDLFQAQKAEWHLAREEIDNLTVIGKAAWIKDEVRPFAIDASKLHSHGSSLCLEKKTGHLDGQRDVECVDFPAWLRCHVKPTEKVRLKMDIEGAEYDILPKMLADGTINLIDELLIEWHDFKIGVAKSVTKKLTADIKRAGVRVLRWK